MKSILLQVIPPPPPPPPNGGPPGGFTNGPFEACTGCVPIDQGVILLVVVGLILGTVNLVINRKKHREQW